MQKTNAMRMLDRAKIQYEVFEYDENLTSGELVAEALDEDKEMVFKTLVTESDRDYFVFVVPVAETLDLKKCAKAAKVKSVSMLKQKDLFDLTGYIHGGCSPVGMKKQFKTFIHRTARDLEFFFISGGRVGAQVKLAPDELKKIIDFEYEDLIQENS